MPDRPECVHGSCRRKKIQEHELIPVVCCSLGALVQAPSQRAPCCCARLAAYVVTPHLMPFDDHDTTAPPLLIEALAAPAARPAPIERLEGAVG